MSQGCAFLFGIIYVLRNKLAPFQIPKLPKWEEVKLILHLGLPAGLQMSVISAGSAAVMSVVTEFGSKVVGGFSAARPLDNMFILPSQSLGVCVSSLAVPSDG